MLIFLSPGKAKKESASSKSFLLPSHFSNLGAFQIFSDEGLDEVETDFPLEWAVGVLPVATSGMVRGNSNSEEKEYWGVGNGPER